MKWLTIVFILLVIGAVLGPVSSGNAGYVLVQFAGWSVETSVVALAISLFVVTLAVTILVKLVTALIRRTRSGGQWFSNRRDLKAAEWLHKGQAALLNENYLDALLAFEKAHKKQDSVAIAALASYAAQRAGEFGKAEYWRELAGEQFVQQNDVLKRHQIARLASSNPSRALAELKDWLSLHPKDQNAWRQALQLAEEQGDWVFLSQHIEQFNQLDDFSGQNAVSLKYKVFAQLFIAEGRKGKEALYEYWRSLSRSERADADIRLGYAKALHHLGLNEACAKVVYKGLKRGELSIEQVTEQKLLHAAYAKLLEFVQDALKRNPEHAGYIRALALLAVDSKDYSLAQRALRKLIDSQATADDYKLLGDVYNALGDSQLAANAYKKALA